MPGWKVKQVILMLLRVTRLMGLADKALPAWHVARNAADNRGYRKENPALKLPPRHNLCDVSARCNHRGYYAGGLPDARFLISVMRRYLPGRDLAVCQWGYCARKPAAAG